MQRGRPKSLAEHDVEEIREIPSLDLQEVGNAMNEHKIQVGVPSMSHVVTALRGLSRRGVSNRYLCFRIRMLEAQSAALCSLQKMNMGLSSPKREIPLDVSDVNWDNALLAQVLRGCISGLAAIDPPMSAIRQLSVQSANVLPAIARSAAFGQEPEQLFQLGRQYGIPRDLLTLLGRAIAAPFVTEAAMRLCSSFGILEESTCGLCNCCGADPGLSILRKGDGRRILTCSLCGQQWLYSRVKCPFCGDGSDLRELTLGERRGQKVEACGHCNRYVKTLDGRVVTNAQELVPLVAVTEMLFFDLLTEDEGLLAPSPFVAMPLRTTDADPPSCVSSNRG